MEVKNVCQTSIMKIYRRYYIHKIMISRVILDKLKDIFKKILQICNEITALTYAS
jgi:hypothetical protein